MARGCTPLRLLASREYDGLCHFQSSYITKRFENAKYLYRKDLFAHYGCVNAIEFSSDGNWLASGGDDRRVLLWNISKTVAFDSQPNVMVGEHNSNIFCLGFDNSHSKVFSAGNDEQVVVHNIENGKTLDVFMHEEAVYGLSVHPSDNDTFASACDNGQILIWDTRQSPIADPLVLAQSSFAFHAVVYNPVESRILATANAKEGVALWDVRKPRVALLSFGGCFSAQSSMSVRFSRNGMNLLALRRRLPPVLYNISSPCPVVEFDHPGYYNSCTMKSCTFAGNDDEYVMSGSDDFKLYMWKIPPDSGDKKGLWQSEAHIVLKGHRSIVNQVRYSPVTGLAASSGVEKVVKLWSLFPFPGNSVNEVAIEKKVEPRVEPPPTPRINPITSVQDPRHVYSHEEYINLVLETGQFMTHDYSHKSMNEDPRMMAFFDSLVQRDIEGWTSDSSDSSLGAADSAAKEPECLEVVSLPSSSDSNSSGDEINVSAHDGEFAPQTLSYITTLTNRVEANLRSLQRQGRGVVPTGDTNETDDGNRISQLIARRRHEQLLRTARNTVKLTQKRLRRSKNGSRFVRNANKILDAEEKTLDGVRKILDNVLLRQAQNQSDHDRRRSLRRRIGRLAQSLSDSSDTSSDDESIANTVVSAAGNSSNEHIDSSVSLNEDIVIVSQNGSNENGEHSSDQNFDKDQNGDVCELKNPGVPCDLLNSEDNVNGNCESVAGCSSFKALKNNRGQRNYRVQNRQHEEGDEED